MTRTRSFLVRYAEPILAVLFTLFLAYRYGDDLLWLAHALPPERGKLLYVLLVLSLFLLECALLRRRGWNAAVAVPPLPRPGADQAAAVLLRYAGRPGAGTVSAVHPVCHLCRCVCPHIDAKPPFRSERGFFMLRFTCYSCQTAPRSPSPGPGWPGRRGRWRPGHRGRRAAAHRWRTGRPGGPPGTSTRRSSRRPRPGRP